MPDENDLHLYGADALRSVKPYRCTSCGRIGLTATPRPRCFGQVGDTHDAAPMDRVPERFRDRAVDLVVR